MTDHRSALTNSYEQAAAVVTAVRADQLALPTPCPDYDVATLVDHLVGAAHRAAALGRGETPTGYDFPHVELADAPDQLRAAGKEAADAWADDARLTATTTMPWGETYGGATIVDMYLAEIVTHSWDLATATGQVGAIDEDLAAVTVDAARSMIKLEYRDSMGKGNPFGAEVGASPSAPASERLAAFMGRQPR
ncbi:MAG: TIGR03086 family metal-binding protein [Acidimicrobiales bacterium]